MNVEEVLVETCKTIHFISANSNRSMYTDLLSYPLTLLLWSRHDGILLSHIIYVA